MSFLFIKLLACYFASIWALASARLVKIHMVTYGTPDYIGRLQDSLRAKLLYAKLHGMEYTLYTSVPNEELPDLNKELKKFTKQLDCTVFREVRWRGDQRYCKMAALKSVFASVGSQVDSHWVFWHDIDTHIMHPRVPLLTFLTAADHAPLVFTENGLSLNNGAFFLSTAGWGAQFFKSWLKMCTDGEWPWADNGCMLEMILRALGGSYYTQECTSFSEYEFDSSKPFLAEPRGGDLSKCYNEQMEALGHPCCGDERQSSSIVFLTGNNSFNHHTCGDLLKSKDYADISRDFVKRFCFKDDGSFEFMVHSKDHSWGKTSLKRMNDIVKKIKAKKKDGMQTEL